MGRKENNECICMKSFGDFELTYAGKSLLKGKSKESQITLLLQVVLHEGKSGVTREQLEEVLFDKRDMEDKHHALRSVLYNTKKKLKALGLPEINYIFTEDGVYYWNDEIEVKEDAKAFDEMYLKAVQEADPMKKAEYYIEACHLYSGEFLPGYNMILWAATEARRYQKLFDECVREGANLLWNLGEFQKMAELGTYASDRIKFAEYEMITMEALQMMGNYQEAITFYEQVEEQYMKLQDMVPAPVYQNYIDRLARRIENSLEDMGSIQESLLEDDVKGAYYCAYPVFKGIYQMATRSMPRNSSSGLLISCTIAGLDGVPLKKEEITNEMAKEVEEMIAKSIRKGDVYTKYSCGRYLLLMAGLDESQSADIEKRIDKHLKRKNRKYKVVYHTGEIEQRTSA